MSARTSPMTVPLRRKACLIETAMRASKGRKVCRRDTRIITAPHRHLWATEQQERAQSPVHECLCASVEKLSSREEDVPKRCLQCSQYPSWGRLRVVLPRFVLSFLVTLDSEKRADSEESRLREANRLEETETRDCGAGQLRGGMPTHRTQPAERTQLTRGPSRLEGPTSSEAPVSSEGPIDRARSLGFEQRIRPRKWSGTEETVARGHGGGVGGLDDRHSLEARLQSLSVLAPQDRNERQAIPRIVLR